MFLYIFCVRIPNGTIFVDILERVHTKNFHLFENIQPANHLARVPFGTLNKLGQINLLENEGLEGEMLETEF